MGCEDETENVMRAAVAAPTHQLPERAHAPPWPQRGGQHAASLTQKELSCATHVTRRCPLGSSPESDMHMASEKPKRR